MHRNKYVILGEDGYTNRSDNAPRNIFSLIGFALKILKSVSPSPTRAIEQFQDDRNKALRLFSGWLWCKRQKRGIFPRTHLLRKNSDAEHG